MSQTVHLIPNNFSGCGVPEGLCLPCSGISGRTAAVYSCSSLGHIRVCSHVKIRGPKCVSVNASFVCKARRNPDFSRQNKQGFSRSRNRNNEGKDSLENFEEDMLSSKNGPLLSLSSSEKSHATSAPGPREKEIVELFRKVQARLRERAVIKEEKKVEASQRQSKENGTVDSLLKLLKRHSVEQVKRSSGGGRGQYFSSDQSQDSSQHNGGRGTKFSDLDSAPKVRSQEANISVAARPQSNFQRRSPIPRIKYQPVSHDEDDTDPVLPSSEVTEKNQDQIGLKLDDEPELDSGPELDPKDEMFFPDMEMGDLSEDDSPDSEQADDDEHEEEQVVVQNEDLSVLKLSELRDLAKSRGLKGYSKMKKGDLVELLT